MKKTKSKARSLLFRKLSRKFNIIMAKNKLIKTKLGRKSKKITKRQSKSRKFLASRLSLIYRLNK